MTEKQTAKFKRSESYRAKLAMAYPFGLDDKSDEDWKVILMICGDVDAMRAKWEAARDAAGHVRADSAFDNARDTVREGRFAEESYEFFSCALGSLNP